MEETFDVDVFYEGAELVFKVALVPTGYTYRFIVVVNDTEVIYEPDEEQSYRAIINDDAAGKLKEKDYRLIKAIAERLEILRS